MEALVNTYRGRRVLVTGHTGFKGAWLCAWLQRMGAEVAGFALAPETVPDLYTAAGIGAGMRSEIADLREFDAVAALVDAFRPEIVFHLGAQALVRRSYRDPVGTYASNVMGTVHVLEAVRHCPDTRAVVIVTSDKCYENREWVWGYREDEAMGGHDPYSSSKGCAELVTAAYRRSFFAEGGCLIASARAGNVIGGGDWSEDRLVPDLVRAIAAGVPLALRYPGAVRPWQHVLEPLHGYLRLGERLLAGEADFAEGWNFGPGDAGTYTVHELTRRFIEAWGDGRCELGGDPGQLHEAGLLQLDIAKARRRLHWAPLLDIADCVRLTVEWYRGFAADPSRARALVDAQLAEFDARIEAAA